MDITCVSDLHGHFPKLEGGDLLIIAGDLTARDTHVEYLKFYSWLHKQNYKHYIFIAGNHDNLIEKGEMLTTGMGNTTYLCDSGAEFEGLKIWGTPWSKTFPNMNPECKAFTCNSEEEIMDKFEKIPHDTDILITHSPAHGILDGIPMEDGSLFHVGSKALYGWFKYCGRPKLHVCAHIHEGYGQAEVFPTYNDKMMISVNASHVNELYQPMNKPIRIIL